jgi:hypothetical protein
MGATLTSITGLQNLTNLQDFRADWNSFTSIDLSGLPNLTYIDISDCDIPGSGTSSLTSVNLAGSTAIEELRLDDSDFSAGIPNMSELTNLNYLDIDGSNIAGAVDISAQSFNNLTYVDLSANNITSISLPEAYISYLSLSDNALTQEAVDDALQWLDGSGVEGGSVYLTGGTNSVPSSIGFTATASLVDKGWTVQVNEPPPGYVGIAASTDFNIVGDFTIEMFVNVTGNVGGFPRLYSFGSYPAANAISIEAGATQLYFWANDASLINGSATFTSGSWNHIAVMGSGSNAYLYLDGVQIGSNAYTGSISSQGLPLTIGYGNENQSEFEGLMSNFRWSNAALYPTASFTVPTAPLTSSANTVLLTFQGNNITDILLDNSGNNHNGTNSGAIYSTENPFAGVSGSLQMG